VEDYFNIDNHYDDYENIKLIHRIISLSANKEIYNIENDVFFLGQKKYLFTKEKDFEFLKENEKSNKNTDNKNNKFIIFQKYVDKLKKIV
jgi:hypothetical protein